MERMSDESLKRTDKFPGVSSGFYTKSPISQLFANDLRPPIPPNDDFSISTFERPWVSEGKFCDCNSSSKSGV
jgi:hypothetical protein